MKGTKRAVAPKRCFMELALGAQKAGKHTNMRELLSLQARPPAQGP